MDILWHQWYSCQMDVCLIAPIFTTIGTVYSYFCPTSPLKNLVSVSLCIMVSCVIYLASCVALADSVINVSQSLNPADFGDTLKFPLAPLVGWHLWFWVKLLNKLLWNLEPRLTFYLGWIVITLVILNIQGCHHWKNISNNLVCDQKPVKPMRFPIRYISYNLLYKH